MCQYEGKKIFSPIKGQKVGPTDSNIANKYLKVKKVKDPMAPFSSAKCCKGSELSINSDIVM